MPFRTESTYHDRQRIINLVPQATSLLNTYEDIIDDQSNPIAINIRDLNQPADYIVTTVFIASASAANTVVTIRASVNGTPSGTERSFSIKTSGNDFTFVILSDINGLEADDQITAEWKTDKGVVTMVEFTIVIHGIACSRIVT